eukprot:1452912-Prymnesium_polylepis.1
MSASCPPTLEASRRAFRLRLMSPRAYRDREAKVTLFQRCRSGGRRRLTAYRDPRRFGNGRVS